MTQRRYMPINGELTNAMKGQNATITGNWTFSGTTAFASGTTNSVKIEHDGTYGILHIGDNDDSTEAIKLSGSVSDHLFPGFQVLATDQRIIADDGTDAWALECDGGIYWVMAGSTTATEVHYLNANWNTTTTHSTISTNGATHFALGTGSNPDTDGDHNIWFTNGGKTLNIKNRRGSSRYYCVYIMSGRS